MIILAQQWAQAYGATDPGVSVQVSGGGSGTGIAALLNGTTDIANASREIHEREREQLREDRGVDAREHRVAIDAVAVYVNEGNPIRALSVPELREIFRGRTRWWSDVGGARRRIVLYGRENNSGTYAYFKEHVLDRHDFAAEAQSLPGTAAVIHALSRDVHGIGYGGIGYGEGVVALAVAAENAPPVRPGAETAVDGSYPLARFLFMYTAGEASEDATAFLRWILSDEGQAVVEDAGFFPLPPSVLEEERAKL